MSRVECLSCLCEILFIFIHWNVKDSYFIQNSSYIQSYTNCVWLHNDKEETGEGSLNIILARPDVLLPLLLLWSSFFQEKILIQFQICKELIIYDTIHPRSLLPCMAYVTLVGSYIWWLKLWVPSFGCGFWRGSCKYRVFVIPFLPCTYLPYLYCHSPTQPKLELVLDLIIGRKPPPHPPHQTGTFKALPGNIGSWFLVCNLILTQLGR